MCSAFVELDNNWLCACGIKSIRESVVGYSPIHDALCNNSVFINALEDLKQPSLTKQAQVTTIKRLQNPQQIPTPGFTRQLDN